MNRADKYLVSIGRPECFVHKCEGVWYLLGDCDDFTAKGVERCLHVVRLSDLSNKIIDSKINELVGI